MEGKMEINLEPRYRNYWLDLARKEEKEKEEAKRKEALSRLVNAIDLVAHKNNQKKP
jgi:hypothetical protein